MNSDFLGENRNCIKRELKFPFGIEFNQYDSYGNNIFKYVKSIECCGNNNKYIAYDIDQRIIGSVECQFNCEKKTYSLYDENNQLINYIKSNNDCCTCSCSTVTFNFYDKEKNIENILIKKDDWCSTNYELYDKYNCLTNKAEYSIKSYFEKNYYYEYDVNNPDKVFKINLNPFKIFENENEVDLADKTLFNNGFSKIQIFLILDLILFYSNNNNSSN